MESNEISRMEKLIVDEAKEVAHNKILNAMRALKVAFYGSLAYSPTGKEFIANLDKLVEDEWLKEDIQRRIETKAIQDFVFRNRDAEKM